MHHLMAFPSSKRPCQVVLTFSPKQVCFTLEVIPMDGGGQSEARRRLRFSDISRDLLDLGAQQSQIDALADRFVKGKVCTIEKLLVSDNAFETFRRTAA